MKYIYVLEVRTGWSGYTRLIKVVKASNAKEARKIASKSEDNYITQKEWYIIAKTKDTLK